MNRESKRWNPWPAAVLGLFLLGVSASVTLLLVGLAHPPVPAVAADGVDLPPLSKTSWREPQ